MQTEYADASGRWELPPETVKTGLPVPDEDYIKNVRANCLLDLPNLCTQRDHDKIMLMVCGGPTAKQHLDEIRAKRQDPKYAIFCSNKTHDWLIGEGIVPDYHFIIDPKPSMLKYVENPHKGVKYLIGISCDNRVFQSLEGYDVTRVFSVSGIGTPSDVDVIRALFPYQKTTYLFGGSMAGLRAMSLADVMGFLTMEYYGFDSCYFQHDENGDPIYYSYDKKRKENLQEAQTADGKIWLTTPVFASQANQFIKWKQRYEWIDFIVHGESLTASINRIENENRRPKHDLLITEYHKTMNVMLHDKELSIMLNDIPEHYGCSGQVYAGHVSLLAGQIVKKAGSVSVLDYGCGMRTLEHALPPIGGMTVQNYDPCIEGLDERPEPADLVVCTDVLEHVEPECLENVLNDLQRVTKKLIFLAVSTRKAQKTYSDGQNAHKIVEDQEWWRPKLRKRFNIIDTQVIQGDKFIMVAQAKSLEMPEGCGEPK